MPGTGPPGSRSWRFLRLKCREAAPIADKARLMGDVEVCIRLAELLLAALPSFFFVYLHFFEIDIEIPIDNNPVIRKPHGGTVLGPPLLSKW